MTTQCTPLPKPESASSSARTIAGRVTPPVVRYECCSTAFEKTGHARMRSSREPGVMPRQRAVSIYDEITKLPPLRLPRSGGETLPSFDDLSSFMDGSNRGTAYPPHKLNDRSSVPPQANMCRIPSQRSVPLENVRNGERRTQAQSSSTESVNSLEFRMPSDNSMRPIQKKTDYVEVYQTNNGDVGISNTARVGRAVYTNSFTEQAPVGYRQASLFQAGEVPVTNHTKALALAKVKFARGSLSSHCSRSCSNCGIRETRQWVRGESQSWLCHSCGQFWRKNGCPRPQALWNRPTFKRSSRKMKQENQLVERRRKVRDPYSIKDVVSLNFVRGKKLMQSEAKLAHVLNHPRIYQDLHASTSAVPENSYVRHPDQTRYHGSGLIELASDHWATTPTHVRSTGPKQKCRSYANTSRGIVQLPPLRSLGKPFRKSI